jgi:hypothetical protein
MSHIAPYCSLMGYLEPGLAKTLALPPLGTWIAGLAERIHCCSLLNCSFTTQLFVYEPTVRSSLNCLLFA